MKQVNINVMLVNFTVSYHWLKSKLQINAVVYLGEGDGATTSPGLAKNFLDNFALFLWVSFHN